ncbi:MAG: ATP-binding cassette domain-containing protein [Burkholderiales bacterium]|nr:ATP-binding cassette domain-containing protein [Burkholderiales bacterium]
MSVILEARSVSKSFGAVTAADNINVRIESDSVIGLIGSNGAGKTTFLNMVTGYLKPTSGCICFDGRDITRLGPRLITRLGICRSFQIPQLFDTLSVRDNLLVGIGIVVSAEKRWKQAATISSAPAEAVERMIKRFDLQPYRDMLAGTLPEGVRKLLDIAMAMIVQPRILLLDEPTSGVSAEEKFALMDLVMEAVRKQRVTVLFVEHDMEIVTRYTHRVLAFSEGRIIADDEPEAALNDPEVRKYIIGETLHVKRVSDHAAT